MQVRGPTVAGTMRVPEMPTNIDNSTDEGVDETKKAIILTVVVIYAAIGSLFILVYILVHYSSKIRRAVHRYVLSIKEYTQFLNMRWRYRRAIDLEKYVETINYSELKTRGLDGYKYGQVILDRKSFEKMASHADDCTCGGGLNKFSVAELKRRSPDEIENAEETCCICLEPLKTQDCDTVTSQDGVKVRSKGAPVANSLKDTDIVMIPCQHYFHAGCLKEWFSPQRRGKRRPLVCPLCRMDLVKCKAFCVKLGLLMSSLTIKANSETDQPLESGSEPVSEVSSDSN